MLKPGALLIYKTPDVGQWVGTVLLHCCRLLERPSKKDGFCFKLFHPLDQSVWAVKVPEEPGAQGRGGAPGLGPRGGTQDTGAMRDAGTAGRPGGRALEWGLSVPNGLVTAPGGTGRGGAGLGLSVVISRGPRPSG